MRIVLIAFSPVNTLIFLMKTCCCFLNKPHGGDEDQHADISSSAVFAVSSVVSDVIVGDPGDPREKK